MYALKLCCKTSNRKLEIEMKLTKAIICLEKKSYDSESVVLYFNRKIGLQCPMLTLFLFFYH